MHPIFAVLGALLLAAGLLISPPAAAAVGGPVPDAIAEAEAPSLVAPCKGPTWVFETAMREYGPHLVDVEVISAGARVEHIYSFTDGSRSFFVFLHGCLAAWRWDTGPP